MPHKHSLRRLSTLTWVIVRTKASKRRQSSSSFWNVVVCSSRLSFSSCCVVITSFCLQHTSRRRASRSTDLCDVHLERFSQSFQKSPGATVDSYWVHYVTTLPINTYGSGSFLAAVLGPQPLKLKRLTDHHIAMPKENALKSPSARAIDSKGTHRLRWPSVSSSWAKFVNFLAKSGSPSRSSELEMRSALAGSFWS
jgi:hypothetical protein